MARTFRQLLRLLPARVRARHGADMQALFDQRVAEARARGGRIAVWRAAAHEFWDTIAAAVTFRDGADPLTPTPARRTAPRTGGFRMTFPSLDQDLKFAFRLIRRQPVYALTVVLTLALGIGANAAVFSVIYGVLLRPLPYRGADRLVSLFVSNATSDRIEFSPLDASDLAAGARTLASMSIINVSSENLTGGGEPQQLSGALVGGNFFETLGAEPVAGRAFTAADADADPHVVVLSERVWRSRLGGDRGRIGTMVQLDGASYRLAAVIPDEAAFPERADFWRPIVLRPNALNPGQRGARYLDAIGRLKDGVSAAQAREDLSAVFRNMTPQRQTSKNPLGIAVVGLREAEIEAVRPALYALGAGVLVLLLIACSNIANLTLTQATARTSEIAVRASLGAGRGRVVRQLLVESLTLAGIGAVAGMAVAAGAIRWLLTLAPPGLPGFDRIAINGPVLLFALGIAVVTGMIFGLYPAWNASRVDLASLTRSAGTRSVTGGGRARRALAVAEVAMAVMLLGSAGLLVQTMAALSRIKPGFNPENVLTFNLSLPNTPYDSPERRARFFDELSPTLAALPGVTAAGVGAGVPFTGFDAYSGFTLDGIETPADGATTSLRVVGGNYFKALEIPVRAGREFNSGDRADTQPVAIVNERLVARFFQGQNPVGRLINVQASIASGAPRGPRLIVGVVGDVKAERLEREAVADVYLPYSQQAIGSGTVVVRTAGDPMALMPAVRARLAQIDAALPLADVKPMTALVGESAGEQRLTAALLAVFAAVAAAVAAVGLYGVFSVGVSQRLREVGIRMALGATGRGVLLLFIREGFVLAVIGAVLGLVGLRFTSRLVASLLVGVTATDAVTFAAAATFLAAVAVAASYLPARRAARLNPVVVLNRS